MSMEAVREEWIRLIESKVRIAFGEREPGHDWHHVDRVRKLAVKIAKREGANEWLVEMAALLHDVDDAKFAEAGSSGKVADWLAEAGVPESLSSKVRWITERVSFRSGSDAGEISPELAAVRDADRLDAIGAIGVARAFSYGGYRMRPMHDGITREEGSGPDLERYRTSASPTIAHFYEKLLYIRDRLHTPAAREMAGRRDAFMREFLREFLAEWEGEA